MENISHSVVGLALGEVVHRSLAQESSQDQNKLRRNLFVFITLLSANFPDIDIVLTNLLPAPLGYLLHHRGHTHTFFYLLPQMLFLGLLIPMVWKSARKLLKESRTALFGYLICLVLGFLSHIGLDSLNSYGIHPFHPFDNNWYYGDLVFIIEPIFWIFIGVPLLSSFRNKWIKYSWATFLYTVPVALSIFGYLSLTWVSLALFFSSLVLVFQIKLHRPYGFLLSFSMCIGFILMQNDGQSRAQTLYEQQIMHKQSINVELALNPMPTQNQCWMFV
ncbi:MAG: metal-dependent hydrolase, partial [Bacteriovoracaceae bacterium]|nr:metal-dependent hydrolase [Bacteriovoracaceae bacterium]